VGAERRVPGDLLGQRPSRARRADGIDLALWTNVMIGWSARPASSPPPGRKAVALGRIPDHVPSVTIERNNEAGTARRRDFAAWGIARG